MSGRSQTLPPGDPMFFYERFAERFDDVVNHYDTNRRLELVFDQLLADQCAGKRLLDAGCGTGWFSARAVAEQADVVSLDVGPRLLDQTAAKCESVRVAGSVCDLPFADNCFDIVISSEVIEHTPDPRRAVTELVRVLRPGGRLVVTVPNRLWHPTVVLANWLGIRPYEGYENWVTWRALRRWCEAAGTEVQQQLGFHLVPFVWRPLYPLLRWCDRGGSWLGRCMVNIALLATKRATSEDKTDPLN